MARLIASLFAAAALASCGGPLEDEGGPIAAQQRLQTGEPPAELEPVEATVQGPATALEQILQNPAPRDEERFYAPCFPLPQSP